MYYVCYALCVYSVYSLSLLGDVYMYAIHVIGAPLFLALMLCGVQATLLGGERVVLQLQYGVQEL